MNSIRKNTIAILIFAALFTNSLVAETGIDHGNSGDDEGIIAYKGVKKSTFQAGKRNLPLRKLKRKFKSNLTVKFSPEFESQIKKTAKPRFLQNLIFDKKRKMKKLKKAFNSGIPFETAINEEIIRDSDSFFRELKNNNLRFYDMNQMSEAYNGDNLKVLFSFEINNDECPYCKPEDFKEIPQKGIELKIRCRYDESRYFGVNHAPIIIYSDTNKIDIEASIGSSEIANFYRLEYCDNVNGTFKATTECVVDVALNKDRNTFNNVFKSTKRGIHSWFFDSEDLNYVTPIDSGSQSYIFKDFSYNRNKNIITVDEFLEISEAKFEKRYNYSCGSIPLPPFKTFDSYRLKINHNVGYSYVMYENKAELNRMIKETFLKAYNDRF